MSVFLMTHSLRMSLLIAPACSEGVIHAGTPRCDQVLTPIPNGPSLSLESWLLSLFVHFFLKVGGGTERGKEREDLKETPH